MRASIKLLVVLVLLSGTVSAQGLQYSNSIFWSRANDLIQVDSLLYCAFVNGIQVVNVSNPANPVIVNKLFCLGNGQKFYRAGDYLYLADGNGGLCVIDISDHLNPYIIGHCQTPSAAKDVYVDGNYAYVADSTSGLQVVNVTNPASPQIISSLAMPDEAIATSISVNHTYAFIGNNPLFEPGRVLVADISDPLNPFISNIITNVGGHGPVNSIIIADTVAFFVSGECYIYNISNSEEPTLISIFQAYDPLSDLTLRGNLGFGTTCLENMMYGLYYIDFSNLLHPVARSRVLTGMGVAAISVDDSCAYLGTAAGIEIYDITEVYSINLISNLGYDHDPSDLEISGDYAYIADGEIGNLEVVKISDPLNIYSVASMPLPDFPFGISISGDYAYIADYGHGLQVVNIENPLEPELAGEYVPLPNCRAFMVQASGNYSYLANFDQGFEIIDVSNPSEPALTSEFITGENTLEYFCVAGNYAYLGSQREASLYIIDLSNPQAPTQIGTWGDGDVRGMSISGNYVFMSIGNNLVDLDVTDPAHPAIAGELRLFDYGGMELELWENFAIIGSYCEGVKIVDISSPDNMRVVSEYNIPGYIINIKVIGNYCYVFTTYSLLIFELSPTAIDDSNLNPLNFYLSQNYPNPFNAQTTISYSLPESGPITLTVYNLIGQKVATLFDGMQAAGEHSLVWNAQNQPSGVYWYRISAGRFIKSETMLLLK